MPKAPSDTPWLGQRGGVYYAFWYDAKSRQRRGCSLRTQDPAEAKERFAYFLLEGKDVYTDPVVHGLTAGKALDDYFGEHVREKCVAWKRQEDAINNLRQHFQSVLVKDIDIPMCRRYVERRLSGEICGRGHSKEPRRRPAVSGTIRRELVVLTAAINHARKWKRITLAEVPYIELPPDSEANDRWLTREELDKLRAYLAHYADGCDILAAAKPDDRKLAAQARVARAARDFTEIAYYTGSRRRAVETLTWFQVDFDRMTINLSKPGERRTKKRRPVVRIDPALLPTLRRLWNDRTNEHVLGASSTIYAAFQRACQMAGIKGVTPHTLRHTRATHLLQDGVPTWDVAGLLGDTIKTIEDNYGHHSPDYQKFVAEKKEEA